MGTLAADALGEIVWRENLLVTHRRRTRLIKVIEKREGQVGSKRMVDAKEDCHRRQSSFAVRALIIRPTPR